jgi:hypothetical protein
MGFAAGRERAAREEGDEAGEEYKARARQGEKKKRSRQGTSEEGRWRNRKDKKGGS